MYTVTGSFFQTKGDGDMRALRQKAGSQRGASITFALLLFLVCAVISSVVIVAATAAAGRMSERAAIDQRYYAVTSAIGLLRDDFNGKIATVQYKIQETNTTPETVQLMDGTTTPPSSISTVTDYPILKDTSEMMVSKMLSSSSTTQADRVFTLTPASSITNASLDCTIKEYIFADRKQVVFEVENTPPAGSTNSPVYTLQVVFNANISKTSSDYVIENKKTSIVTTTIAWQLANIKKGKVAL